MPDAPASPPPRRDRSIRPRRKTRDAKAKRERQIIDLLNRGVSVAEIASLQRVSIMHMRKLVRKILSERAPEPPAEYLALQVSRLNEALLVSYSFSDRDQLRGGRSRRQDRARDGPLSRIRPRSPPA